LGGEGIMKIFSKIFIASAFVAAMVANANAMQQRYNLQLKVADDLEQAVIEKNLVYAAFIIESTLYHEFYIDFNHISLASQVLKKIGRPSDDATLWTLVSPLCRKKLLRKTEENEIQTNALKNRIIKRFFDALEKNDLKYAQYIARSQKFFSISELTKTNFEGETPIDIARAKSNVEMIAWIQMNNLY
jgi:hypothetical protein